MELQVQEFYQLITITFSSTNNDERKNAEQQLIKKCLENPKSIESLLFILSDANYPDVIREASSILITTIIKRLLTQPQPFEIQIQMHLSDLILQAIKSLNILPKIKVQLAISIGTLVSFDKLGQLRTPLQNHCRELFDKSENLEAGCYLFQSLINSIDFQNYNELNFDWIVSFFNRGVEIAKAFQMQDISNKQSLFVVLNLYKLWSQCINELTKKVMKQKLGQKEIILRFQNLIIQNAGLQTSLQHCLLLPMRTEQNQYSIVSQQGDALVDSVVNESKGYLLGAYNNIINVILNERSKNEAKQSPFYNQLFQLLPIVIVCLIAYVTQQNFDLQSVLNNKFVSEIINHKLRFITYCGCQTEFYQIFSESKTSLLVDVIYPFISTSQKEFQQMLDEPEEFVNLALDTVDKQQSDIPKTTSGTLLEMLCDHIDGSTTFISQIAIMIINHAIACLSGNQPNFLDPNNPYFLLKDVQNRYLFTKMSPVSRIETSLVILTVMSYLLSRRGDLIRLLEDMLRQNHGYFNSGNLDPLVQTRLSLFLGYYCDNLFKSENALTNLHDYFSILIGQLKCKEKYRFSVMYQSVDALKNIFEDEDLVNKIKDLVAGVFPILCESMLESNYDQHFEMIQSIIKIYSLQISSNQNLLQILMNSLVQRVQIEQKKVNEGMKDNQLFINKVWNIIRSIPEIEQYVPKYIKQIEDPLLPLYGMLENPRLVEFDEDIFLLVSAFIEKSQTITEPQRQLLLLCPLVHQKQKFRLGQMYEMLNLYVTHGQNIFQDPQIQKIFFEICFNTMNCNDEIANEADQGEGVLLIHLAIQRLKQIIDVQNLKNILQAVITRSNQEIEQTFLKSRLLGVFLSAFLCDFERTIGILSELSLVEQIFNNLIDNANDYEEGYDIKLFTITMCHLLHIPISNQIFSVKLIDTIVTLLHKQQTYEQRKIQKQLKNDEEEEDDMFDDEDSDELFNDQKQEANISLETFKSEIKNQNEFDIFKQTMFTIKNNEPDKIEFLKTQLHQSKIQFLQDILLFTRIETNDGLGPPRKIFTVTRRKKQL